MMADVRYEHGGGAAALKILDEVTDLYMAVRAGQPHANAELYSREAFTARTTRQANQDGFDIVCVRAAAGELVGFAFGVSFGKGRWWSGNPTLPPPEILDVLKFAVIELNVSAEWRGHGIGHRLMDELLSGRPEPYAILTTSPDEPARQMYARWGWQQVGTAQHTSTAPVMDQLVLPRR